MKCIASSALILSATLAPLALPLSGQAPGPEAPGVKKLTPVLCCEAIEPCLEFWVEQLGLELTMSLPASETSELLGFAMLNQGAVEVMLQTYASMGADLPDVAARAKDAPSFLFLEVEDLAAVAARLGETEIVKARHETFYGSTEITVRSPGGHYVTLAEMTGD